ncbi:TetR/AcrR family transcriptional regulator C-terminal domain-containing protein [Streptomyces gamaensis]|uniref:TetR/AcrR family transcriptional regulator C-terminal domain-containing protein n=1 Tax=Streptomyces gamaensis TaxID=1763542 RepID=A0ABW0YU84_9ACTN
MGTRIDRAKVADTALRLLNDVGLEGLTLRLIAGELGVRAPALYWHFKNKQELLDEMATEMFRRMADSFAAAAPGAAWQERMAEHARVLRRYLLGYRDGAKVFGGTRYTGTGYAAVLEHLLGAGVAAGMTPRAAARAWFTVYAYTLGHVIEEQSVRPEPGGDPDPVYDQDRRAELLAGYPLAIESGRELFVDMEAGYEAGLRAVVAGIEATLAGPSVK